MAGLHESSDRYDCGSTTGTRQSDDLAKCGTRYGSVQEVICHHRQRSYKTKREIFQMGRDGSGIIGCRVQSQNLYRSCMSCNRMSVACTVATYSEGAVESSACTRTGLVALPITVSSASLILALCSILYGSCVCTTEHTSTVCIYELVARKTLSANWVMCRI